MTFKSTRIVRRTRMKRKDDSMRSNYISDTQFYSSSVMPLFSLSLPVSLSFGRVRYTHTHHKSIHPFFILCDGNLFTCHVRAFDSILEFVRFTRWIFISKIESFRRSRTRCVRNERRDLLGCYSTHTRMYANTSVQRRTHMNATAVRSLKSMANIYFHQKVMRTA